MRRDDASIPSYTKAQADVRSSTSYIAGAVAAGLRHRGRGPDAAPQPSKPSALVTTHETTYIYVRLLLFILYLERCNGLLYSITMATEKQNLNEPVANCQVLSGNCRSRLLGTLWGSHDYTLLDDVPREPYMEYYAQQCDSFIVEQDYVASHTGEEPHIRSHLDLINVANELLNTSRDRATTLEHLREAAGQKNSRSASDTAPTDVTLENSLNWAVRLVTMVEVGELKCAFSHRRPLLWEHGTLPEFLSELFTPKKPPAGHVRLEKTFNALNLERLAGISIEWTSDLASHLSLRDDDTKLLVFQHAAFLRNAHFQNSLFPDGFQGETLRTLALLFPNGDQDIRKWLRKQPNYDTSISHAGITRCPRLRADDRQIENFHFWRERLSILKQIFDESEPKTISQWWFDRRKGPQWYTFWVAVAVLVLTIFFGLIQSIEGALQVYKTWYPPT